MIEIQSTPMNQRPTFSLLIVRALALLLILGSAGCDRMHWRSPVLVIGNPRITFVFGTVQVRPVGDDAEFHAAEVGETLAEGYTVKTGKDSKADIVFQTGMAVRLTDNSELLLEEQSIRKMLLNIKSGSLYGNFHRLFKEQEITVVTPTALASVRGTELGFEVREAAPPEEDGKDRDREAEQEESEPTPPSQETTVYTLSGLIELVNPTLPEEGVYLSYQNQSVVGEQAEPGEPERMGDDQVERLRRILNSIHLRDVILITDKITFDPGSADIDPSSFEELDRIVETLEDHDAVVRIDGHTDSEGPARFNRRLSLKRAGAIRDYLVSKGIPEDRLRVQGWGESRPVAGNDTSEGRRANRRVEFVIDE